MPWYKYDGSSSYYNDHESNNNDDNNDDDEYIIGNRDEEEIFSYLWQKEKGAMGDRQVFNCHSKAKQNEYCSRNISRVTTCPSTIPVYSYFPSIIINLIPLN